VKTLEESPRDATHWSTRSMAASVGTSQTAVSRIWRAFGLKPHLVEGFKLSPDPLFIDKVRGGRASSSLSVDSLTPARSRWVSAPRLAGVPWILRPARSTA